MRGFFAFTITFSILFAVWRTQFTFFRRYGLEDRTTVLLNAVLLFVILFFVYPLKFVIGAIMERVLKHAGFPDPTAPNIFTDPHAPILMLTYGLGWSAVFAVFALLYRHANSKRHDLQLSELEIYDTEQMFKTCVASSFLGLLAGTANLPKLFMAKGDTADVATLVLAVCTFAIVAILARGRRKARSLRKAMLASMRAVVEA